MTQNFNKFFRITIYRVEVIFYLISFFNLSLRKSKAKLFDENQSRLEILKSIWVDSFFCANFLNAILFNAKIRNLRENAVDTSQKCRFFAYRKQFSSCFYSEDNVKLNELYSSL